jgi:hypothetical protein
MTLPIATAGLYKPWRYNQLFSVRIVGTDEKRCTIRLLSNTNCMRFTQKTSLPQQGSTSYKTPTYIHLPSLESYSCLSTLATATTILVHRAYGAHK